MADFNICNSMLVTKHGYTPEEAQKILNSLKKGKSPESIRDRAERIRAVSDFVAQQRSHADSINQSAIENILSFVFNEEGQKAPMIAFRRFMAFMTGSTAEDMTLNSVASGQLARIAGVHGRIVTNFLRETGMTRTMMHKLIIDKQFGLEVVREMFPFDGKQKGNNHVAFTLAKFIAKEKERVVKEANAAGASIPYDPSHVTTQFHDRTKMIAYGRTNWIRTVQHMVDKDRVFNGGPVDEDLLGEIFDHIADNKSGDTHFSMAEVMSQHRALVFKNADEWLRYNSLFGHEDPMSAIIQGLEVQSDRTVLMQRMGADPELVYNTVTKELRKHYLTKRTPEGKYMHPGGVFGTSADINAMEVLDFFKPQQWDDNVLLSRFNQINGEAYIPGNISRAKISSMITNFHIFTKMGKAMLSSFSDLLFQSMTLHYQGQGFFESYANTFRQMKRTFPIVRERMKINERDMFAEVGIGIEGILGSTISRYVPVDSFPGKASRMADAMFFWNGLNMWTNAGRDALSRNMSSWLAKNSSTTWKNLNPDLKRVLGMYGIDGNDWKIINKSGGFTISHRDPLDSAYTMDRSYITPDHIRMSSKSKRAQALANKLEVYFVQESRIGVPQIGADDKAWMMRNMRRGNWDSVFFEQFWLFRSFGVAIARQMYPRMKQMGIGATMAHLTPAIGLGYASLSAKALAKGRELPDPTDPDIAMKAFMQSGVAGIAGDLIYSNFTQYHSDFGDLLLGPSWGTLKDTGNLFKGIVKGDKDAAKAWGAIANNTPYANLFYLEPAVNYGFLYHIQESVSPGYLKRMETAVKNLQNNDYIEKFRPSTWAM